MKLISLFIIDQFDQFCYIDIVDAFTRIKRCCKLLHVLHAPYVFPKIYNPFP